MFTDKFTDATFAYFDGALEHGSDPVWFEAQRKDYEQHVAAPFARLVAALGDAFSDALPDMDFSPRKITKPLRRGGGMGAVDKPLVRSEATVFFSRPATSMFEMNPGIYISLGARPDDNVYGVGLYMPSSRQLGLLRPAFLSQSQKVEELLQSAHSGDWDSGTEFSGERYKRFPRGYDEQAHGAHFLWHKQVYLGKEVSPSAVIQNDFSEQMIADLTAALPFLQWLRATVGTYIKDDKIQ